MSSKSQSRRPSTATSEAGSAKEPSLKRQRKKRTKKIKASQLTDGSSAVTTTIKKHGAGKSKDRPIVLEDSEEENEIEDAILGDIDVEDEEAEEVVAGGSRHAIVSLPPANQYD
jgi:hypothetical protein